jgi:Ca2+/H+ antiporter
MMGQMTLSYGAAQIIAPAVTASIAVRTGTYVGGLYLAAAAMVMGIVLLLFLMRLEPAKAA